MSLNRIMLICYRHAVIKSGYYYYIFLIKSNYYYALLFPLN